MLQFTLSSVYGTIHPRNQTSIVSYIGYFGLLGFFSLVNVHIHLSAEINAFNNTNLGASTSTKMQNFVERLIPRHIWKDIYESKAVCESAENVTLLFADIVGFTSYSSEKQPTVVVDMLSKLFSSFDKECSRLNLYKLYTIGDCYVVMSFLDKRNRQAPERECADVIELGFKMIEIIARVRKEVNFPGLHMRIGVHTGKIIGGIIGTGVIRYDIYGPDVVVANTMESSGQNDQIHISQATKDMLEKLGSRRYRYQPDESVNIKALEITVKTYFIDRPFRI